MFWYCVMMLDADKLVAAACSGKTNVAGALNEAPELFILWQLGD